MLLNESSSGFILAEGCISSSSQTVFITIDIPKDVLNGITITQLYGRVRSPDGYLDNSTDINFLDGYTVSAYRRYERKISILVTKSTKWKISTTLTDATNNMPCSVQLSKIAFTVS